MTTVENVIYRMKNLKLFEVEFDLPDEFVFKGRIPFDMKIEEGRIMAKVYAIDLDEAYLKVADFFEEL